MERSYFEQQFERIRSSVYLRDAVTIDRSGGDVPSWFRKIGFILSTSDIESFHLAMIEGMVSRSVPIVFEREGASSIVDERWIVADIGDAADRVSSVGSADSRTMGQEAHVEAVSRYSNNLAANLWLRVLQPDALLQGLPVADVEPTE